MFLYLTISTQLILTIIFLFINTTMLLSFYKKDEESRGYICNDKEIIIKILLKTFQYQIIPIFLCLLSLLIPKSDIGLRSLYSIFFIISFLCGGFLTGFTEDSLISFLVVILRFTIFVVTYYKMQKEEFGRNDWDRIELQWKVAAFSWSLTLAGYFNLYVGGYNFFYQG